MKQASAASRTQSGLPKMYARKAKVDRAYIIVGVQGQTTLTREAQKPTVINMRVLEQNARAETDRLGSSSGFPFDPKQVRKLVRISFLDDE